MAGVPRRARRPVRERRFIMSACAVCAGPGLLLKQEERHGEIYRAFRCNSCRSIWCPDRYAEVSPDYVDRTADDITPEVLWLQGVHKHAAFDQLFRWLNTRGHRTQSVLDVGCGTGGFLAYAKSLGVPELYGFDAAAAQTLVARDVSEHVRCCVDVSGYVNLLGRAPHWDVVTLWDVIEHIRDPRSLLAGLKRYCAPNTLLFFSTPNGVCEFIKLHARRLLSAPHSFIPWEHVLYYSPRGVQLMLEENGFEIIHLTGTVCYPRRITLFEIVRRTGFLASRRTPLTPQLFVIARRASR